MILDIDEFLMTLLKKKGKKKYTEEGYIHFKNILEMIEFKMFNPDKLEGSFVTHCYNEDWDRASWAADTRNKEAIEILDMFREFNTFVKKSIAYIVSNRERKLTELLYER